jgi:hypothetical protein
MSSKFDDQRYMNLLRHLILAVFLLPLGSIAAAGEGNQQDKKTSPCFSIATEVTKEGGRKKVPSGNMLCNPGGTATFLLDGAREVRLPDGPELVEGLLFGISVSSKPDGSIVVDARLSRTEIDKLVAERTQIRTAEVRQLRTIRSGDTVTIELDDPQKSRIAFKVHSVTTAPL